MPKIYKRNCDTCGEYYKGHSQYFCNSECRFSLEVAQDRLLKNIKHEQNGCWTSLYTNRTIKCKGRYHSIFKIAYSLENEVDFENENNIAYIHICENIKCVNPKHLTITTKQNRNKYVLTTVEQRFWSFVNKREEDKCWEWEGVCYKKRNNKNIGNYGKFAVNGKTWIASRFSYELHYGEIPEGLFVCHKCDNPPCVNPEHLFLGTQKQNVHDMLRKGRGNFIKKYSDEFVEVLRKEIGEKEKHQGRIRARDQFGRFISDGVTYQEIANKYNLTAIQVWQLLNSRKSRSNHETMGD